MKTFDETQYKISNKGWLDGFCVGFGVGALAIAAVVYFIT
jgi:hypothetical protein